MKEKGARVWTYVKEDKRAGFKKVRAKQDAQHEKIEKKGNCSPVQKKKVITVD